MSKLNASCSSVICFSCPTCSGENCSLPSSLQLTLTDLKTYLSHHLETSLVFHPVIPLIAGLSPVAPHFPWSAVPTAGYHNPRKALLLSYEEEGPCHASCRLHSYSHIPQQFVFVFFLAAHCCHVQLVTGYKPKGIFLYHCYPSTLSCAIL